MVASIKEARPAQIDTTMSDVTTTTTLRETLKRKLEERLSASSAKSAPSAPRRFVKVGSKRAAARLLKIDVCSVGYGPVSERFVSDSPAKLGIELSLDLELAPWTPEVASQVAATQEVGESFVAAPPEVGESFVAAPPEVGREEAEHLDPNDIPSNYFDGLLEENERNPPPEPKRRRHNFTFVELLTMSEDELDRDEEFLDFVGDVCEDVRGLPVWEPAESEPGTPASFVDTQVEEPWVMTDDL